MITKRALSVELSEGICQTCGGKREVYNLSGFLYGERLLLTEDGKHYVYLNCFDDTAFDEVNLILKGIVENKQMSPEQETECFYRIFGTSCDLVNNVRIDGARTKIACLSCGADQLKMNEKFPPEVIRITLPEVTHDLWDRLDTQIKKETILREFRKRCVI